MGDLDYMSFALDKAKQLKAHLDHLSLDCPDYLSNFERQATSYCDLDRQKYHVAKPSFLFCGLMSEALTIVSQKGEMISQGSWESLELSIEAVIFTTRTIQE